MQPERGSGCQATVHITVGTVAHALNIRALWPIGTKGGSQDICKVERKRIFEFWVYVCIRISIMYVTTHKTNQATKPKNQLGTKENTQHHPAPTARAKSQQARYSAQLLSVGLARPGRKHAPLGLANIQQTPDTGNNYPSPTQHSVRAGHQPQTRPAKRPQGPQPLRPACAGAPWPAGSRARTTPQRRGRTRNHSAPAVSRWSAFGGHGVRLLLPPLMPPGGGDAWRAGAPQRHLRW
jgi:hypothetical protein